MLAFTVTDVKSFHDMSLLVVLCDEVKIRLNLQNKRTVSSWANLIK
ncbi:Uncharacterised protein [Klebsiella pneumoniae]|nr:Uncharacterised protein [Klebsiella pneumoniae]